MCPARTAPEAEPIRRRGRRPRPDGHVVAAALLRSGRTVTVWNRTAGRAAALVAEGARAKDGLDAAARASGLVLFCPAAGGQTGDMLERSASAFRGRTAVNLATGTPEQARAISAWAAGAGAGVAYLDGAMLAVPETVGGDDAIFLYSGDRAAYDAHALVLEALASHQWCGDDPGGAETWDAALPGTGYGALAGYLHGIAIMRTIGVSAKEFLPVAVKWLDGVMAFAEDLSAEVDARQYRPAVFPVDLNAVAVDGIGRTSESLGIDAAVHRPLHALLARRLEAGAGADSFASVAEEFGRAGST